ncbi:MAG: TerC family protein [Actinobacteria bacterium]|nr:TerC family protein [Actinomycetota bacterium]MSY15089.1 TerC family protein [Actinomycetota bacterium]
MTTNAWILTASLLAIIVAFDFTWAVIRRNHNTSLKEATLWSLLYVSLAVAFGIYLGTWTDAQTQQEFFAGWLTEYSLSFDNLFVFVIILSRLKIEEKSKQLALLFGILIALVFRIIAITLGAAAIKQFEWIFFIFGAFLIYTAVHLFIESTHEKDEEEKESKLISYLSAKGMKPFTIALIALGATDILFALDSIPAIFGLTENVYVVVTANVFALMGLRQLYFLIGGLMQRLIYIGKGLSVILGFIGVKLLFHAFHAVDIHKLGGFKIPDITITQSLSVIVGVLAIATVSSLVVTAKRK